MSALLPLGYAEKQEMGPELQRVAILLRACNAEGVFILMLLRA